MAATTKEARLQVVSFPQTEKEETGMHYAMNNVLSETPGFVFAIVTLAYVVTSLLALAH